MNMSIIFIRILVDTLSNRGIDVGHFLTQSEFDRSRLDSVNGLVTVAEFDHLLLDAIKITDEPALGLHMGNSIGLEAFNLFGFLCMSAGDLRTAIQYFIQYHKMLNDYDVPELQEHAEYSTFIFHYHHTNEEGNRARAEFALAALLRYARVFVGKEKHPRGITFNFATPPYVKDYQTVFPFPVEFSSEHTSITFPTSWLDLTQSFPNANVLEALKLEADKVLMQLTKKHTYEESVYQTITASFDGSGDEDADAEGARYVGPKLDLETVAKQLNLGGRTLRRHLQTEGVTFSDIMQRAMGDIAKKKLQTAESIQEVAYAMGFSEPSSFSRAFSRWTQLTPQQYRSGSF